MYFCTQQKRIASLLCLLIVVAVLQISPRASVDMYIKTALILSGLVVSFYGSFFCFTSFWVSIADCSSLLRNQHPPVFFTA